MYTFKYKLNKDLTGRSAIMLSWNLSELPFYTQIILSEERVINASSLIGILSAGLQKNQIITFAIREESQLHQVQKKLQNLDFLQEVKRDDEYISQ